jgi:4-aminobutyrate aminotransferase-like enzyme
MTKMNDASSDLIARRRRLLGPSYELFYDRPVHLVRGEGVWLFDADGERYLDAYNNVVSVGHCHPHVVAALARQAATLNTHTRYLDETILDYAERLLATAPPHLGHALFTCTGSEANDLAIRIARHATGGHGVIVTDCSYHGATIATAALSTSAGGLAVLGEFNAAVPRPNTFHSDGAGARQFLGALQAEVDRLCAAGKRPAALLLDSAFSSDGIFFPAAELIQGAGDIIHRAGGLLIADEVQSGFGRLGTGMWGFARYGLVPDLLTLGKPMGDGHPVAGVMARPELLDGFGAAEGYFNTFGGNPVSAAVGIAVLDVVQGEGLIENARRVGDYLREEILTLKSRHGCIVDVRGAGLYCGVELVGETLPSGSIARRVANAMRQRRVLVSSCGPGGTVLKIRPPLVFAREHVDQLVEALDAACSELA